MDRFGQDTKRSDRKDHAFKTDRKVSDLSVTVDMLSIRGLGCIPKAEGRKAGCKDMDHRLCGVGEQCGAVGHPPRKQFSNKHGDRDREAQAHGALEGRVLGRVCQESSCGLVGEEGGSSSWVGGVH